MKCIMPVILGVCLSRYLCQIPLRRNTAAGKGVCFAALLALTYIWREVSLRLNQFFPSSFLLYVLLFLLLCLCSEEPMENSAYHAILLYLCTDSILWGASYISARIYKADYFYKTVPLYRHLLFVGPAALLMLQTLYFARKRAFRQDRIPVSGKQIGVMLLTIAPILYMSNIHTFFHVKIDSIPSNIMIMRFVLSIGSLITIAGYESLMEGKIRGCQMLAMEQMLHNQHQQYMLELETSEMIRQQYHDIKNQFYAAMQKENAEEVREHVLMQQKKIEQYDALYHTGNDVLDIILSEKSLFCLEHGIQLICVLDGKEFSFLKSLDLCTIFGNALDNAIESVLNMEDQEKRLITVHAARKGNMIVLQFENAFSHPLVWYEDHGEKSLISTKEDVMYHGLGLKGIRQVAGKYQGNLVIETKEDVFRLTILLHC